MLGIIVVVYKNFNGTVSFINKELRKITLEYKCVVVNNAASNEDTKDLAKACNAQYISNKQDKLQKDSNLFVINSSSNLGYAKGNNLGVDFLNKHFHFDYFLFSNDDIEIQSFNCIEILIEVVEQNPLIGGIGPRVIGLDGRDQSPHNRAISIWRQIAWNLLPFFRRKSTKNATNNMPKTGFCYWVSGAFFLIKANVFNVVEGFDPHTFLYAEEKILAERLKSINHQFYFLNNVSVLHYEGGSTKQDELISSLKKKIMLDSDCYYYLKYMKNNRIVIYLYKTAYWINKTIYINIKKSYKQ